MRLIKVIFFCFTFVFLIAACKEEDDCTNITTPVVKSNSPVTEGDTLWIEVVNAAPGDHFNWTGPDDFKGVSSRIEILDVTLSQAGSYEVATVAGQCASDPTTTDVVVEKAAPPCDPPLNTLELEGYKTVSFGSGASCIRETVYASSIQGIDLKLYFHDEPKEGVYTVVGGSPWEPDEVNISVTIISASYHASQGGFLFVTEVNGKLQFTFCGVIISVLGHDFPANAKLECI